MLRHDHLLRKPGRTFAILRGIAAVAAALMAMAIAAQPAQAVTTYTISSNGTGWSVAGNWSPSGPAAGAGNFADYNTASTALSTSANVASGTTITIGQIQNLNTGNWAINPGTAAGGFILNNTGGVNNPLGDSNAFIGTTNSGTLGINVPVTIANTPLDIGSISSGGVTLSGSTSGLGNLFIKDNGSGATTLSGNINNAGTITNSGTSSGGLTISGLIGGNVTGINQNSAGSGMTLSGNNTAFMGSASLVEGTLTLNNINALAGASSLAINGATTLTANVANISMTSNPSMSWNGLWTYNSNTLNLGTGTVALNGENVGIITNTTNNLTVGGNISGAASLTKSGPSNGGFTDMGAIVLNGTNSYTGGTIIQQGQVQFGSSASLPSNRQRAPGPLGSQQREL